MMGCKSLLGIVATAFLFAGCDTDTTFVPATEEPVRASSESAMSEADAAWAKLTSSGERPERLEGETSLAYFLRKVELANIRRRELGLQFWRGFPEDPRRYDWLMLTVHMPPRYGEDIILWSTAESEPGPNDAPVNAAARSSWETVYPELRAAFWASPSVTDWQRRFLWFGELEQRLERGKEAVARGEDYDADILISDIIAFTHAYPEPMTETDLVSNNLTVGMAAFQAVRAAPMLGLGAQGSERVARRMLEESAGVGVATVAGFFDDDGTYIGWNLADLSGDDRAWAALPPSSGVMVAPMRQEPGREAALVVGIHDAAMNFRKNRDWGLRLWRERPVDWRDEDAKDRRLRWITGTLIGDARRSYYIADIEDGFRAYTANEDAEVSIDSSAAAEWRNAYAELREALMGSPGVTRFDRMRVVGDEQNSDLVGRVRRAWTRDGDNAPAIAFVAAAVNFHRAFGDMSGQGIHNLQVLLNNGAEYGLDSQLLLDLFRPLLADDDERLRQFAQSAFRRLELRVSPPTLAAPTMGGEPFELADLRGKIVLVEHWNTSCASCIEAMPQIHDVYLRYKKRGFEVVSVAYDGVRNRRRVKRIEHDLDLTWTTLAADEIHEEVYRRFAFTGFPQYWLLNRDGTLYADTDEVNLGRNLETLLNEILAAEAEGSAVAQ